MADDGCSKSVGCPLRWWELRTLEATGAAAEGGRAI
jgi:hypothetical protein